MGGHADVLSWYVIGGETLLLVTYLSLVMTEVSMPFGLPIFRHRRSHDSCHVRRPRHLLRRGAGGK
jgi:hypothetical protein